jgi:cell filamentation protein, protein adenylyltransferase
VKGYAVKKTDLSPERRELLVPLSEYPGAHALVPPAAPRSLGLEGIHRDVTKAHEALGALQAATASLPNPNLVTRTFDRREAVRSSQIEGTSSDVDELMLYEATGSDEGLPSDVVVTLNYVKALAHGLRRISTNGGAEALTCELIKELHFKLMDGTGHGGTPGAFRNRQNWIGGFRIYDARFVPPPWDRVEECMHDLESLLRYSPPADEPYEISVVIRMAIAHAQFETIHPFIDGNGRVGRILLPLMLAAEGFPPVYLAGFLKANQQAYYDSLAAVQLRGEWTEWVRFLAAGVRVAAQESVRTAESLTGLLERWKTEFREAGLRSDSVVHRLPELLISTPVVTIRSVENALGISFPAASSAVSFLEKQGILKQPGRRQRNRTFIATEVIDILNRSPEEPSP